MDEGLPRFLGVLVLLGPFVLSGCLFLVTNLTPTRGIPDETMELNEDLPDSLAPLQRNCVVESLTEETPFCPRIPTGYPYPSMGVRILDSMYVGLWGGSPALTVYWGDDRKEVLDPLRTTFGALRIPLLLPGLGSFFTYYGIWDDVDGDGWIRSNWTYRVLYDESGNYVGDTSFPLPDNEWVSLHPTTIVTFLHPGRYPSIDDTRKRIEPFEPDILYTDDLCFEYSYPAYDYCNLYNYNYRQNRGFTVFPTGSLLSEVVAVTVQGYVGVADPDSPYLSDPEGLVDVDLYAEINPLVGTLYRGSVGRVVEEELGSPSFGVCPTPDCKLHPLRWENLPWVGPELSPLGAVTDPLQSKKFAPYLPEYLPGSNSTGEGLRDALNATYVPWIDLLLEYSPGSSEVNEILLYYYVHPSFRYSYRSPLPRTPEGRPFMLPGDLVGTVWIGAWRDLNGDGHVGVAESPDPYVGGMRPLADDYVQSRGEFYPGIVVPKEIYDDCAQVNVTLTWIPITVFPDDGDGSSLQPLEMTCPFRAQAYSGTFTGDSSYVPTEGRYVFSGWYEGLRLFFPFGSSRTGFWVCAGPVEIRVEKVPGGPLESTLFDCDHVERAGPQTWASWVAGYPGLSAPP